MRAGQATGGPQVHGAVSHRLHLVGRHLQGVGSGVQGALDHEMRHPHGRSAHHGGFAKRRMERAAVKGGKRRTGGGTALHHLFAAEGGYAHPPACRRGSAGPRAGRAGRAFAAQPRHREHGGGRRHLQIGLLRLWPRSGYAQPLEGAGLPAALHFQQFFPQDAAQPHGAGFGAGHFEPLPGRAAGASGTGDHRNRRRL